VPWLVLVSDPVSVLFRNQCWSWYYVVNRDCIEMNKICTQKIEQMKIFVRVTLTPWLLVHFRLACKLVISSVLAEQGTKVQFLRVRCLHMLVVHLDCMTRRARGQFSVVGADSAIVRR